MGVWALARGSCAIDAMLQAAHRQVQVLPNHDRYSRMPAMEEISDMKARQMRHA